MNVLTFATTDDALAHLRRERWNRVVAGIETAGRSFVLMALCFIGFCTLYAVLSVGAALVEAMGR